VKSNLHLIMPRRTIARTYPKIIAQTRTALEAARDLEVEIGIHHNRSTRIEQELIAALGEQGDAPSAGAQAELNVRREMLRDARVRRDEALAEAKAFCANAIDGLKARLGRRWNPRWMAVGFTQGSLAIPRDPTRLLYELRDYFRARPDHEHAALEITAAQADALAAELNAALSGVNVDRANRNEARRNRDVAMERLRRRLSGLHAELRQLLPRDDHRWSQFGFRRPIDKGQPDRVEDLTVRTGGRDGELIVEWMPSPRATSYRLTRQIAGMDPEPVEVGTVHEPFALVSGLPEGIPVTLVVHARNRAGETKGMTVIADFESRIPD
jgi:hypothetical protein